MMYPNPTDLLAVAPEIILTIAAAAALLIDAFAPGMRRILAPVTMIAAAVAAWSRLAFEAPGIVWSGLLSIDRVATFVDLYILIAVFLTAWMAGAYLRRNDADRGEFYSLLLLAAVGAQAGHSRRS